MCAQVHPPPLPLEVNVQSTTIYSQQYLVVDETLLALVHIVIVNH